MFAPNVLRASWPAIGFGLNFFTIPKKAVLCWFLHKKTWNLLNVRVDKAIEAPQKADQEDRNDMDSNIQSHIASRWGLSENHGKWYERAMFSELMKMNANASNWEFQYEATE